MWILSSGNASSKRDFVKIRPKGDVAEGEKEESLAYLANQDSRRLRETIPNKCVFLEPGTGGVVLLINTEDIPLVKVKTRA